MKNRYTVVYEKSDKWWAVRVEGLPGALSQGRTLTEARENIKEAIVMVLEAEGNQGCVLDREGARHTMYRTADGSRWAAIPRHRETNNVTGRAICEQLEVPPPPTK
jgi:predicted RNase H-like HicB family nuclease